MASTAFQHKRTWICLLALLSYLGIAALFFGLGVLNHLNTRLSGVGDDCIYIWSLAWWKYALSHHIHVFLTKNIWAPDGYNLAKATTLPAIFLITLPIQLLSSVNAAYNISFIFAPGLAAWTMFLLCYWLVKSPAPALIAGYFFGFSGYMLMHMLGHLNLVAGVFVLPLLVWFFLLLLEQEIGKLFFIISSTLCLSFLFLVSIEMFATFTLCSAIAVLLALITFTTFRKNILSNLIWVVCAYLVTMIIVSPYLYYFFMYPLSGTYDNSPITFSNDLLGFLTPTQFYWLRNNLTFSLDLTFSPEQNGYLGLPLLFVIIFFGISNWSKAYGKFLIILSVLFAVISLGPILHVAGKEVLNIYPVKILFSLPFIKYSLAARYAVYMSFAISLIVALWLQHKPLVSWRYALIAASILFLIPTFNTTVYPRYMSKDQLDYPFFSKNLYRQWLSKGDNVLIIPMINNFGLYYQAQSHFYFNLTAGYIGTCPNSICHFPVGLALFTNNITKVDPKEFQQFIIEKKVNDIIVPVVDYNQWQPLLSHLTIKPVAVGGIMLYKVH